MIFLYIILILAGLAAGLILFLTGPAFGRPPTGHRLQRLSASRHFHKGRFANLAVKPMLTNGATIPGIYWDFFFRPKNNQRPPGPIPAIKTNLRALPPDQNLLVWFGHSSYFIQVDGKKILVDPVLKAYASPAPFAVQAFDGATIYQPADLPDPDYLFITHDHWDHLEYESIRGLRHRTGRFICPLGVGSHLERWGVAPDRILETDWDDSNILDPDFTAHTITSHHFSGRDLRQNRTLWASYALLTPTARLFLGGDGGYGPHYAQAGRAYGPFDLAMLENGQYNQNWKHHHMHPLETLAAAKDLRARTVLPIHSGRFVLSSHPWDEPLKKLTALPLPPDTRIITPKIGQVVRWQDQGQVFDRWWEKVKGQAKSKQSQPHRHSHSQDIEVKA